MENLNYNKNIASYVKNLNLAIKISQLGSSRLSDGNKMTWTCVLHVRLCVMGSSLRKIAPKFYNPKKLLIEWDYSSMFTLTRNIMECYQTLFYLCSQEVSEDEKNARKRLFDLHDFYSRKKMFSFTDDKIENIEIEQNLKSELANTEYFKKLDEKRQKYFLKGDNAFFISRENIEEQMGEDKNEFKLLYKLFSSNTHSFPMGFYRMLEGERGNGVATDVEVNYSALALEVSEYYIKKSSNDMIALFPDIKTKLNLKEKKILE
ncbi:DUF5677 domain-containing protein [Flavobacterium sp. ARAG 55.4]|uniref:DUF5677 domain-containing protein n=1 Tax=Flavobacterium sp. ARAG 55.4 TaxID=3451357 RepID=UPI003F45B673